MIERLRLGSMGTRLVVSFLTVALVPLVVLTVGVITVHRLSAMPVDTRDEHLLLLSALVAGGTALVLAVVLARRLVRPIDGYIAIARALAAGEEPVRPPAEAPAEFADLTAALVAAADELQRSGKARRQLTADIAHELRTPMAALQAGLEELREGYREPDEAALAGLHAQALRMGRILDDLAALSAVESSRLHLRMEPVDLQQVVDESMETWRGALLAAGLRIDTVPAGVPVQVVADADRVHQMVGNLLANAVQYCRAGDQVQVGVASAGDAGVVVVADSGPGLPAQELPYVFDRGWRSRTSSRAAGSGLGLPIVRALALAQGGTVAAAASPAGGLELSIGLPLVRAAGQGRLASHPPEAALESAP